MSVRFMPDGRLRTEQGSMLDGGADMTSEDALVALGAVTRVLLHSYPHTEDITGDLKRVRALLAGVSLHPELEGHGARLFRNASERILVIDHRH